MNRDLQQKKKKRKTIQIQIRRMRNRSIRRDGEEKEDERDSRGWSKLMGPRAGDIDKERSVFFSEKIKGRCTPLSTIVYFLLTQEFEPR